MISVGKGTKYWKFHDQDGTTKCLSVIFSRVVNSNPFVQAMTQLGRSGKILRDCDQQNKGRLFIPVTELYPIWSSQHSWYANGGYFVSSQAVDLPTMSCMAFSSMRRISMFFMLPGLCATTKLSSRWRSRNVDSCWFSLGSGWWKLATSSSRVSPDKLSLFSLSCSADWLGTRDRRSSSSNWWTRYSISRCAILASWTSFVAFATLAFADCSILSIDSKRNDCQ